MPTSYPAAPDTFIEPSLPESTSLSSAGSGDRNHTEHHRDLGDAMEAVQRETAQKGHDHSGDGTDVKTGKKLAQANTHEEADTDQADSAIHHTLGENPGQAAPGDHRHDYNGPSIYNQPYLLCESTSRPGQPYPGLQIYETDTNRVRVWTQFLDNQTIVGTNGTDTFDAPHTDTWGRPSLDPADWDQWYADDPQDRDHGAMGVVAPGYVSWTDEGSDTNRCIARRIRPADKETVTDDQVLIWKTGTERIEEFLPILTETASNDYFLRMSADRNHYWRVQVGNDWIKVYYTVAGPNNEQKLGELTLLGQTDDPGIEWRAGLVDRTISFYRQGIFKGAIKDNKNLSSKGAAFRGWGIGMTAGDRLLGQTSPGSVDWVRMQDNVYYQTVARWTLLPVANRPVVRLLQNGKQKIPTAGAQVEWRQEVEDSFGYFDSAISMTDIRIAEPGLYSLCATIQWAPDILGDWAFLIVMINGVETRIRNQGYIAPGFMTFAYSESINISDTIRFNAGDVLSIRAKHNRDVELWTHSSIAEKIDSRLALTYEGP